VRRLLPLTAAAAALVLLVAPAALAAPGSSANEVVYVSDTDDDGVGGVVLRDLTTRTARVVLPEDQRNDYFYESPELSPADDRIALATDRGSEALLGIAVVNRNGTGFRRLTTPAVSPTRPVYDRFPSWSPDGTKILFSRITLTVAANGQDFTATSALYTVTTSGTPVVTPAPGTVRGFTGDWNPDGSKIVYASLAPSLGTNVFPDTGTLTIVNRDGTGSTPLVAKGASPAWSPDGASIAYSAISRRDARGDTSKLAVIQANNSGNRLLNATQPSAAASFADAPTWTPDSRSLLYDLYGYDADTFPRPSDIWAVDRTGARAGRVVAGAGGELQPSVQGPALGVVQPGARSTFTPVTPRRILDTRRGLGAPTKKVGAGGTLTLPIAGLATSAGLVPADATAVVLNVTVANATVGTDVRAYPSGSSAPSASNVNAARGAITPNLVTTRLGPGGAVVLRNSAGTVDLVADIAGYYRSVDAVNSTGVRFAPVQPGPGRILDTRRALGAPTGRVGRRPLTVKVTGTLRTSTGGTVTVPGDASAVVLNVTSTQSTLGTDVRVYPTAAGTDPPGVSNLNVRAGKDTANLVTVRVGTGGTVQVLNRFGSTHLVADIAGYYGGTGPNAPTNAFVPVAPARFLDTRAGIGAAPIPTTANGFVQLDVGGSRGVPQNAVAAVLNVTGTSTTGNTDVRGYPVSIGGVPLVSNLNLAKGDTRANLAIVRLGTGGELQLLNRSASTHLLGDLAGYFLP